MKSDEFYMQEAIDFAKKKNQCWPFSAVIVDNESGRILVKATDCAHISPAFHAESYAIHHLALNFDYKKFKSLTIYSTAECDLLSAGAVMSAIITGYNITRLVYAVPQADICDIWKFKYIDSSPFVKRLETKGKVLKEEATQLFREAKSLQEVINSPHPGKVYLSRDLDLFYELTDLRD